MSDLEAQSDDEAVEDSSSSNDGTQEGDDVEEAVVQRNVRQEAKYYERKHREGKVQQIGDNG